jgi:hypothetical protein
MFDCLKPLDQSGTIIDLGQPFTADLGTLHTEILRTGWRGQHQQYRHPKSYESHGRLPFP